MQLIGKINGMPVFEIDNKGYVAVNVRKKTVMPMWSWYANLGKWYDTFEKCSSCEEENDALSVIEDNIEEIVSRLNACQEEAESESGQVFLEEQEEFYQWLETGREYDWFDGYTDVE